MKSIENNWGGARPNSGRKKTDKVYKTVSICGTEAELTALKKQAQEKEKTLSRYVIEELVKDDVSQSK